MSIRPNFPNAGGFVLSYRWLALGVALSPPAWRGGFVLSYRWLASGVAFGRPVRRRLRLIGLILSSVRLEGVRIPFPTHLSRKRFAKSEVDSIEWVS